jgi:acyl-CoA thioesterase-1
VTSRAGHREETSCAARISLAYYFERHAQRAAAVVPEPVTQKLHRDHFVMARGFESKDVEFQQAEAQRGRVPSRLRTTAELETTERRRTIELSLARAEADLVAARSPAHREMLQQAIAALRERLARISSLLLLFVLYGVLFAGACGSRGEAPDDRSGGTPKPAENSPPPVRPNLAHRRIVVLGDSLTAGLGLSLKDSYPTLLQERIDDLGLDYTIVNAGVSGDTSAGGLSRLDWALDGDVRILIVALGGNDGLRGLPVTELRRNLSTIIERAQARGITVVLAGMEAPPNYGFDYTASFHKVYPALAKQYGVALVPFLLEGVGGDATLNQADGIHPTPQGARIVADNVWAVLEPLLQADARLVARGKAPGR